MADFASKLKRKNIGVLVVTSNRHSKELIFDTETTLLDFLTREGIDFAVAKDINTDEKVLSSVTSQTLGLSMGSAWIFRPAFINRFEGRLLNLHETKLPQDRGGGGMSWIILRNERMGLSLLHQVDTGVDSGSIVVYEEYYYPPSCRLPIDYQRYSASRYLALLAKFMQEIEERKDFPLMPQQEYFSSYWPRLSTDKHGYIDWFWKLGDIERFIAAFDDPYKGAMTYVNNKRVRFKKCFSTMSDGTFHPFQKGIVYRISKSGLFVATEDGSLIVGEVQDDDGHNLMSTLKVGDRFYTPVRYLEEAKEFRAIYTPEGLKE